jgi:hypothetical protein
MINRGPSIADGRSNGFLSELMRILNELPMCWLEAETIQRSRIPRKQPITSEPRQLESSHNVTFRKVSRTSNPHLLDGFLHNVAIDQRMTIPCGTKAMGWPALVLRLQRFLSIDVHQISC